MDSVFWMPGNEYALIDNQSALANVIRRDGHQFGIKAGESGFLKVPAAVANAGLAKVKDSKPEPQPSVEELIKDADRFLRENLPDRE
jgi:hypothetical protein